MRTKCKIESCESTISNKSTGLCHKHHLRFIRTGKTERNTVDRSKKCAVEGCDRYAETKQYGNICLMHHKRFHRHKSFELPIVQKKKRCKYCDREIGYGGAIGMCSNHYRSFKLYGNALDVEERKLQAEISVKSRGYFGRKNKKERHQSAMESYIGRELERGEIVHHINLNKLDNSRENLHLCKTQVEHSILHKQLEKCGAELLKLGYIKFENGGYKIDIRYTTIQDARQWVDYRGY